MKKLEIVKRYGVAPLMRMLKLASLSMLFPIVLSSGAALATPAKDFVSVVVGPTDYGEIDIKFHSEPPPSVLKIMFETEGLADVYNVTNTVKPGGHSGWHTHPGPTLITVSKGTATYYDGDDPTCTPHVVPAGQGFIDMPGNGHFHLVRNAEPNVVLELIAFQIIPAGEPRRIDVAAPSQCPTF
jgi:quercetin dioxygenase-like cupin family protein